MYIPAKIEHQDMNALNHVIMSKIYVLDSMKIIN